VSLRERVTHQTLIAASRTPEYKEQAQLRLAGCRAVIQFLSETEFSETTGARSRVLDAIEPGKSSGIPRGRSSVQRFDAEARRLRQRFIGLGIPRIRRDPECDEADQVSYLSIKETRRCSNSTSVIARP
jgi:hypothetical protein